MTARVTRGGGFDTFQFVKGVLHAPKAATGKGSLGQSFNTGRLARIALCGSNQGEDKQSVYEEKTK